MLRGIVISVLAPTVIGHGQMTHPPTRFNTSMTGSNTQGGGHLWFSQGCQPGCSACSDKFSGDTCSWPGRTMAPTLDEKLRTWRNVGSYDFTKNNPWRAPGFSPIGSPCGLAGGGYIRHPGNGAMAPTGVKQGADGRDLADGPKTTWTLGSVQEVAWAIVANHGGGYAYRLCPKSSNLTEACFQAHHLNFSGEKSWIQYGDDKLNRTAIAAFRTSKGTHPAGSQWTRNPIPACGQTNGGAGDGVCKYPPQFNPPLPGLYGFGSATCFQGKCTPAQAKYFEDQFRFNIIDNVTVPSDLPLGEYVLSFRWDCEQTPQVWAQCADITIVGANAVVV